MCSVTDCCPVLGMTSLALLKLNQKSLFWNKAAHHHSSLEIFFRDTAGTKHVSICKVLSSHITDRKFGQDNFGSRLVDFV